MKRNTILSVTAAMAFWGTTALAQTSETMYNFNVNQTIPVNNPLGLTLQTNLTVNVASAAQIQSVTVSLNVTNGFNGDLYAYLDGPNGGYAVLLNRVGVSNNATQFGYSDAGLNVTFSDAAANSIQYYQSAGYSINSGGQLTGTWQPEGVNIPPNSPPADFFGASQTALLDSFEGTNPNGDWTLFLADLSAGSPSTVVSWGLDIVTVPEPSTLALMALGVMGVALIARRQRQA